jgi:hypothetical protein
MATVATQTQRPARARMPRTKSSLLAFKLREFLNTEGDFSAPPAATGSAPTQLPRFSERCAADSKPRADSSDLGDRVRSRAPEDCVWVDAFFYGFWVSKDKVADYQKSVQAAA